MSQALAQVISYANRAHAFMPYGLCTFIVRYDAERAGWLSHIRISESDTR